MKTSTIAVYVTGNVYTLYDRITKRYTIVYPEADIEMASMVPIRVIEGKSISENNIETLARFSVRHLENLHSVKKFNNLYELHCKFLKTIPGWSHDQFKQVFNTDIIDQTETHERTKICFQQGFQKGRRQKVRDVISKSFELYDKIGICFDNSQIINVGKCTNTYEQGSYMFHGEITLNPETLSSDCMERVLVHELGHRQYYTILDMNAKKQIGETFFNLIPSMREIHDRTRKMSESILINEMVMNLGGGNGVTRGKFTGQWFVRVINHETGTIEMYNPDKKETAFGNVCSFIESGFQFENADKRFINFVPYGTFSMRDAIITDNWFPSLYSLHNEIEWHAENMTLIAYNQSNGKQYDFFTSLIC